MRFSGWVIWISRTFRAASRGEVKRYLALGHQIVQAGAGLGNLVAHGCHSFCTPRKIGGPSGVQILQVQPSRPQVALFVKWGELEISECGFRLGVSFVIPKADVKQGPIATAKEPRFRVMLWVFSQLRCSR